MTVDKLLDSPNSTQLVYMYGYESKGEFDIRSGVTTVQELIPHSPSAIFTLKMAFQATNVKISIYPISGLLAIFAQFDWLPLIIRYPWVFSVLGQESIFRPILHQAQYFLQSLWSGLVPPIDKTTRHVSSKPTH